MKTFLILGTITLLTLVSSISAWAAAPANDKFVNATPIYGRVATLRNQSGAAATAEPLDPYIGLTKPTRSLWYKFEGFNSIYTTSHIVLTHSAAANIGLFYLTDADGGIGSLAITNLIPGNTGSAKIQGNYGAGGTDVLTFLGTIKTPFYICVDTAGTFDLTLKLSGADNDFFEDAITMAGDQGTTTGNNRYATNLGDSPPNSTVTPQNGVWYRWTPSVTAQMVVDTNFSYLTSGQQLHDTALAIFTGSTLNTLTYVAGDDNSGYGTNSRVSLPVTAGTTYYIWVGDGTYLNSGPFTLSWFPESSVGTIAFFTSYSVTADQGTFTAQVRRMFAGSLAPSVTVASANNTAVAGSDFIAVNQTLNFTAPNVASPPDSAFLQSFDVTMVPDTPGEADERFNLLLSAPTAGASLGASSVGVFISVIDQVMAPGFLVDEIRVKENAYSVNIPVIRGSGAGLVTVDVIFNPDGSAENGADYNFSTSSLTFSPGQTTRTLGVSIYNDGFSEGEESFTLSLTPRLAGTPIEGFSSITVIIEDDEKKIPAVGRVTGVLDYYYNTYQPGTIFLGGAVDFKVTAAGSLSGKLIMNKATYPFTGKFDANGLFTAPIGPIGVGGAATRSLVIEAMSNIDRTYRVTLNDAAVGTIITRTYTAANFNAANPCPALGTYTVTDNGNAAVPHFAAATVKVDATGNAAISGKVFDGTAFAVSGGVDLLNNIAAGVTLYSGQGRVTLAGPLPSFSQTSSTANLRLVRPGTGNDTLLTATQLPQVNLAVPATIAIYTPPLLNNRILSLWNPLGAGHAEFTGGGFGGVTSETFNVSPKNVLAITIPNVFPNLKVTFTPASGLFTGTVIAPASFGFSAKVVPVYGVIQQSGPNIGGTGFFVGGVLPGGVRLLGP